jgi:hypothetical protein
VTWLFLIVVVLWALRVPTPLANWLSGGNPLASWMLNWLQAMQFYVPFSWLHVALAVVCSLVLLFALFATTGPHPLDHNEPRYQWFFTWVVHSAFVALLALTLAEIGLGILIHHTLAGEFLSTHSFDWLVQLYRSAAP